MAWRKLAFLTETEDALAGHEANPDAHKGQKNSIALDGGDLQLIGDAAIPGNNKVYGTGPTGTRGWKDDPTAIHDNTYHNPNFATETDLITHTGSEAAGVHGSTPAATANKLLHRDAGGRAKVAAPAAAGDILIKGTRVTMAELPDGTSGHVLTAKGSGVNPAYESTPAYSEANVELGGAFGTGRVELCKIGKIVVVTAQGSIGVTSATSHSSAAGVIPAAFRPTDATVWNLYYFTPTFIAQVEVSTAGTLTTRYRTYDGSSASSSVAPQFAFAYVQR